MNLILNIILLAIETALIVFFSENTIFYKKMGDIKCAGRFFNSDSGGRERCDCHRNTDQDSGIGEKYERLSQR